MARSGSGYRDLSLQEQQEIIIKVSIVGDSAVGKSALLKRESDNSLNQTNELGELEATIGVDFRSKTYFHDNHEGIDSNFKVWFWDTAGQARYKSMLAPYLGNKKISYLVYDITNRVSFDNIKEHFQAVKNAEEIAGKMEKIKDHSFIVLIGNKSDLAETKRTVSEEEGRELAESLGISFFYETSARNNSNVHEAFSEAVFKVYNQLKTKTPELHDYSSSESEKKPGLLSLLCRGCLQMLTWPFRLLYRCCCPPKNKSLQAVKQAEAPSSPGQAHPSLYRGEFRPRTSSQEETAVLEEFLKPGPESPEKAVLQLSDLSPTLSLNGENGENEDSIERCRV